MNTTRKNLKLMSIVILALAAISLVRMALSAFSLDFSTGASSSGASAELIRATQIGVLVFGIVLLLPQIYVGVKGMKIAKNPACISKAPIVWATILAVLSVIGIVSPILNVVQTGEIAKNFPELIDMATDAAVYIGYIGYANQILKSE